MDVKQKAREYFKAGRLMQIATLHDDVPRPVSVYYVASDTNDAVYWMSEARRRHSQDIESHPRVGGVIVIRSDQPVIGLQFTGSASILTDDNELKSVIDAYNEKYENVAAGLDERIRNGTNKHHIYKLTIESLELFDSMNFPGGDTVTVPLS